MTSERVDESVRAICVDVEDANRLVRGASRQSLAVEVELMACVSSESSYGGALEAHLGVMRRVFVASLNVLRGRGARYARLRKRLLSVVEHVRGKLTMI